MPQGLSKGWFARAFLSFFVASLGVETVHFATIDHHFSVDKAEFVHHHDDEECDELGPILFSRTESDHRHLQIDEECTATLTMRRRGGSELSELVSLDFARGPVVVKASRVRSLSRYVRTAIYRLAPKNSPPIA